MGTKKKYFKGKSHRLSVAVQAFNLKHAFPGSEVSLGKDIRLIWEGHITPTPLSQTYRVKVDYRLGNRPNVTVLEPPLTRYDEQSIPHVFSGNKLCLFMYKYFEWNDSMRIDETIIPWISLWL